jgi:maleate cis-trans isomerase
MRKTSTTKKKDILDSDDDVDSESSFMIVEAHTFDESKLKLKNVTEEEFLKKSIAMEMESDGDHPSGIFNSS